MDNSNHVVKRTGTKLDFYVLTTLCCFCAVFLSFICFVQAGEEHRFKDFLFFSTATMIVLFLISAVMLIKHFRTYTGDEVLTNPYIESEQVNAHFEAFIRGMATLRLDDQQVLLVNDYQFQPRVSFIDYCRSHQFSWLRLNKKHVLPSGAAGEQHIKDIMAGNIHVEPQQLSQLQQAWLELQRLGAEKPLEVEYQMRKDGGVHVHETWLLLCVRANSVKMQWLWMRVIRIGGDDEHSTPNKQMSGDRQKMQALVRFADGIAHDYNNLFGIINGYAELMNTTLHDEQKLNGYIEHIQSACVRAQALGDQVLALSRRQKSSQELVDFEQVMIEPLMIFKKNLPDSVTFDWLLAKSERKILLDPSLLEGVLFALGENALSAMEDKGTLRMTSHVESLNASKAEQLDLVVGDYLCFSVIDNGCGMDEHQLAHCLEPYFSTTDSSGFGLPKVYGFMQNCQGAVGIDSSVGQGTRVSLYFPLCE